MKKLITFFSLFLFTCSIYAQTASVEPNEGRIGELLPITVIGQGTEFTEFTQGSSSLSYINLMKDGSNAPATDQEIQSDTEITGNVVFNSNYESGLYDLAISSGQGIYLLEADAFNLLEPSLESISPENGVLGETLSIDIAGTNTTFDQGSMTVWFSQGTFTFYASGETILDDELASILVEIPEDIECGVPYSTSIQYGYNGAGYLNIEDNLLINCEQQITQISGNVFLDDNQDNTYNNDEATWNNVVIQVMPGDYYITTDENGNFSLEELEPGDYSFTIIPPDYYIVTGSQTFDVTIDEDGQVVSDLNFALNAEDVYNDVQVTLSSGPAVASSVNNYWMTVKNVGTTTINTDVTLVLDDALSLTNASVTPFSQDGQEMLWRLEDLAPNEEYLLNVQAMVNSSNDDELNSTINAELIDGGSTIEDFTPMNNTMTLSEMVSETSQAIEKKSESTGGIFEEYALLNQTMIYTINFQNTGDSEVTNVRIEDPIDENLDISTLKVIGASHDYEYTLTDNYRVIFNFNNINLAMESDGPNSQGFIKFSIEPKTNLSDNTVISNIASIYFDNDIPNETNTVENVLVEELPNGLLDIERVEGQVVAVPNPMYDRTELILEEIDNSIHQLNIFSIDGKLIRSQKVEASQRIYIEREDLKSGMYLYELIGDKIYGGKFVAN